MELEEKDQILSMLDGGEALWGATQSAVSKVGLVSAVNGLGESAALLLRVAADSSADARIAERWLRRIGQYASLACVVVRTHIDRHAGEGPHGGGGAATSGAGAKRKEGVQPPGDTARAAEARS